MGWLRWVGSLKLQNSFCKRALLKRVYSAKETYNLKEPTNRSHPIPFSSTPILCGLFKKATATTCMRAAYSPQQHIYVRVTYMIVSHICKCHIGCLVNKSTVNSTWQQLYMYDCFYCKGCFPTIHEVGKLRCLGISRYKFKLRFGFISSLYWGIWISGVGGFWGRSIFSGICHISLPLHIYFSQFVIWGICTSHIGCLFNKSTVNSIWQQLYM